MPAVPNPGTRDPGLRVECDEPVPGRDVEDALFGAVGPIREPTAGELPRGGRTARSLVLAVHPQLLAGGGVERDDGSPRAAGRVEHALDHERRRLQVELRPRPEVVHLEAPRDLERAEVGGGDLIEWSVPGVAKVAAIGRPLAAADARLAGQCHGHPAQRSGEQGRACSQHGARHGCLQNVALFQAGGEEEIRKDLLIMIRVCLSVGRHHGRRNEAHTRAIRGTEGGDRVTPSAREIEARQVP